MNPSALASRDASYTCRWWETRLVEFGTSMKSHYRPAASYFKVVWQKSTYSTLVRERGHAVSGGQKQRGGGGGGEEPCCLGGGRVAHCLRDRFSILWYSSLTFVHLLLPNCLHCHPITYEYDTVPHKYCLGEFR